MKQYGVGMIGCGKVAEEYIKAFQQDARSEVRGLVSRSVGRAEACRAKCGLSCTADADAAALIARRDIDIIVVCTPHDQHTEHVLAAAKAGKHIVIEKPVALNWEEVRAQQAAVRAAGVKSVVGFVLHWNPLLLNIDRLLDEKAFGNVFLIEVDYLHRVWWGNTRWLGTSAQGGTSLLAAGCHAVDALRWFAREKPVEASAYSVKTENPNEYPGTTALLVKFESGMIGRVTSCFDAKMPYVFHVGVYGTEGSLRDDKLYAPKLFPGQSGFMTIPCILPDSADVKHHPFQGEASHLLDCIEQDRRPFPDLDDAVETMALCFAADRSAELGRPVRLDEFR